MQINFKIFLPVVAFLLISFAAQAQVIRSTVIEQYKGKSYYIHFVQTGETLADIAKAYDVSADVILAENPEAQQKVYVNQVLKIPVTKTIPGITTKPTTAAQTPKTSSDNAAEGTDGEKMKSAQDEIKPEPLNTNSIVPEKIAVVLPGKQENPSDQKVTQKQKVTYIEYTVKKKETLYGIAKKFGMGMEDIIEANPGLKVIENGMTLRIPKKSDGENKPDMEQKAKPKESTPASKPFIKPLIDNVPANLESYEVQPKETLYSIAKAHNISIESLIEMNPGLADGLKAGLIIKVPAIGGKAEQAPEKEAENKQIKRQESQSAEVDMDSACHPSAKSGQLFKVALMLPFDLAESDSLLATDISLLKHAGYYKPFNFIQIYEGALLALDSLEKTGANVKFYVYDCDAGNDTNKTRKILLRSEMKDMDLIIGPVFAKSSSTAARFAAKHQINIVNPLSKRGEIVKGNTCTFKVQPSDDAVANKLAAFIIHRHGNANVLIVRNVRSDNPELAKLLQLKIKSQLQQAGRSGSAIPVNDIVYQAELFSGVSKHLSTTKENIVIVLSNNAVFIPDFISRLNNLHKSHNILLLSSPAWETLDPETDYLVNLNYHQYSSTWVDYSNPAIKYFQKKFQSRFSTEPENDKYAFLGYDMTFFFVKALMDYGHDFGPCIGNKANKSEALFDFKKSGSKEGYENTHLNILKIEDYHWVDAEK